MSWLYLVGVLAERYGVTPHQMDRELRMDPDMLSLESFKLVQYAQAKQQFDDAKKKTDIPDTPLMDAVAENTFELHKIRIARRKQQ